MLRSGQYLEEPEFPSGLGYEASGTVEKVGPGVTGLKPGDRVSSIPSFSMRKYLAYGEVALLPAHALAGLSDPHCGRGARRVPVGHRGTRHYTRGPFGFARAQFSVREGRTGRARRRGRSPLKLPSQCGPVICPAPAT